MPHNWASAEFIRLCTHLIELDRGGELHLFEGFPHEWAAPGMVTRLNGVLTPFGLLRLELRVAADGNSARLMMSKLKGHWPDRNRGPPVRTDRAGANRRPAHRP